MVYHKKLGTDKSSTETRVAAVTPNQVAHQLLLNGKPNNQDKGHLKKVKREMVQTMKESDNHLDPFSLEELQEAMEHLKLGKAAGLDGISTEIIKHFGPKTQQWILDLFNICATSCRIPKTWRKAKVVAILKPGKDPNNKKSYRPISLLCILLKLYERLIMGRMSDDLEDKLTPDQAGFRPGRSTCGQLLNLTQFIEDGYENKEITGSVFVDIATA